MNIQGRKNDVGPRGARPRTAGHRPRWWKVVAVTSIVLLVLSQAVVGFGASAQDLQDELNRINNQINQTRGNLEQVERNRRNIEAKLREYEAEVNRAQNKLQALNTQLSVGERELAQAAKDLKKAEENQTVRQDLLRRRIRAIAEYGNVSYLEVLFEATSFSDFLGRFQMLQQIIQKDSALLQEAANQKREVAVRKAAWEQKLKETNDLRNQTQVVQASYRDLQSSHEQKLTALVQDKRQLEAMLDQELADANRLTQEIQKLQANTASTRQLVMVWPTPGYGWITSPFGMRADPFLGTQRRHTGLDIGAPYGAKIVAAESGKVILAQWYGAYGNAVVIDHGGKVTTLYGHSSKLLVKAGDTVSRGQTIAYVGSTGLSTGPHLHFEVRSNGTPVNPRDWVNP